MTRLPVGFRVALDRGTRAIAPGVWSGGSPARVVRLSGAGRAAWQRLSRGPVDSTATAALARRLTDAGLAHPCPPPVPAGGADVTVVVPVRDRPALLSRCLAALASAYPVIVVDDGSRDPAAVAATAAAHGATLVRRAVNGGPAAARNTGLSLVSTELVAFVDSDCVPPPGWIDRLAGHFADPLLAAVAPRVLGGLDLGREPARVAPRTRLSYVPTAALLARRDALLAVAGSGEVFDPSLRFGEDVDLVWRLDRAGWRVRYDPAVRVGHQEPATWPARLARRFHYGTSAAPLAVRHPGNLPPLVIDPWPALTVAALLGRRPLAAAGAFAVSVLTTRRLLRSRDLPTADALRTNASAVTRTWRGAGRYATQYAAPLLLAGLLRGGRPRTAALSLLAAAVVSAPEDVAYGAGVWASCIRHRTFEPLLPVLRRRFLAQKGQP